MTIRERIHGILREHFGESANLADDVHLEQGLGADSLDLVELTMDLEEEFDIDINDDEAPSIAVVGDIIKLVEGKNPKP